jgi:hypothetical protein
MKVKVLSSLMHDGVAYPASTPAKPVWVEIPDEIVPRLVASGTIEDPNPRKAAKEKKDAKG